MIQNWPNEWHIREVCTFPVFFRGGFLRNGAFGFTTSQWCHWRQRDAQFPTTMMAGGGVRWPTHSSMTFSVECTYIETSFFQTYALVVISNRGAKHVLLSVTFDSLFERLSFEIREGFPEERGAELHRCAWDITFWHYLMWRNWSSSGRRTLKQE